MLNILSGGRRVIKSVQNVNKKINLRGVVVFRKSKISLSWYSIYFYICREAVGKNLKSSALHRIINTGGDNVYKTPGMEIIIPLFSRHRTLCPLYLSRCVTKHPNASALDVRIEHGSS